MRRHADVAIGNVLGSNIFNILGILGVSALLQPLLLTLAYYSLICGFYLPVHLFCCFFCSPGVV
nr:hypothetical protein [Pseudoalteromonas sp. XMcav2-N]